MQIKEDASAISLEFRDALTLQSIPFFQNKIQAIDFSQKDTILLDLQNLDELDTAAVIYLQNLEQFLLESGKEVTIKAQKKEHIDLLELVKGKRDASPKIYNTKKDNFLEKVGKRVVHIIDEIVLFVAFLGEMFVNIISMLREPKAIRYKEIAFEINESAIKALGIVVLTSFLIGIVVAYQAAYQLRIYGANIFIVDMIGITTLRELSPVITAIVIAGRSASSYTAQIGAMKITQEIDAMRTMGFEPFRFLVLPRVFALVLMLPILIFISDIISILAGMFIANIHLDISASLFIDRLNEVVALKHYVIGVSKGVFFAILIASIGIYRGFGVKDDTQSVGINTTRSVVESIFAVIICDAIFSVVFTNLGI